MPGLRGCPTQAGQALLFDLCCAGARPTLRLVRHHPPPAIDGIRAPYLMGGVVKEMIYGLKYRNMRASAPELGRLLTAYMESDPIAADVLMPVALHKRRQRERG